MVAPVTVTRAERAKWEAELSTCQTELRVADQKLTACLALEFEEGDQRSYWERRRKLSRDVDHLLSQIDSLTRALTYPVEPDPIADLEADLSRAQTEMSQYRAAMDDNDAGAWQELYRYSTLIGHLRNRIALAQEAA